MTSAIQPEVSIITVVKNAKLELLKTIESIRAQRGIRYEHIIIDGDSQDGSLQALVQTNYKPEYWLSEVDSGVYDAMNKGLAACRGKWVHFLNAGDQYVSSTALAEFHAEANPDLDFVFCNVLRESAVGKRKFWCQNHPFVFGLYWNICHQAMLYNHHAIKNLKYDLKYQISADFHLLLSLLRSRREHRFKKIDEALVIYREEGLSQKYAKQALKERARSFEELIDQPLLKSWNKLNLRRQRIKLGWRNL